MAWYLNSIRIFPQSADDDWDQLVAELNPLAGGSIYHDWGWADEKEKMTAYVVSLEDKNAIRAMVSGQQTVTLSGPYEVQTFRLKRASMSHVPNVNCQTFYTAKAEDAPIYIGDFEFWKDE
jgi:hypothetical protein